MFNLHPSVHSQRDMNTSQDHGQDPQWSYNWNHMALPTFGFIFAVPEPPPHLRLPGRSDTVSQPTSSTAHTLVEHKLQGENEVLESDPPKQSHSAVRLQSRRQRKSETDKRLKQTSQLWTNLSSALQRGNSDPFSAAAVSITPQVNQVLNFARDVCLPAFYFVDSLRDSSISPGINRDVANSSGWISSPAARLGWQQVVDALSDRCTALACLSTYLALMAMCDINPTKATEASLKMRARSSALLRQNLVRYETCEVDVKTQQEVLWQVFWHFYAEFFAGNMVAAQVHGKMLRQSCQSAKEGVITDHFLDSVIFVDSHLAAKGMVLPVLDIEKWLPSRFASTWRRVDVHIHKITGETGERLHPTVHPPYLRTIFARAKQALALLQRSEEAKVYEIDFETIYYWLNSHFYVDSGVLIGSYRNLVENAMSLPTSKPSSNPSSPSTDSLGADYTQAALCLSALFAIRDIGQEVRINGIDVVDASSTIMKHLKEVIEQALTHCTPEERVQSQPAHLWCAFIGALYEQRLALSTESEPSRPPPKIEKRRTGTTRPTPRSAAAAASTPPLTEISGDPSNEHFNHLLAEIACNMGLLSWQQLSDNLRQFIYTDLSEPHGSRWFWKTIGAFLDRRRKASRHEGETRREEVATQATGAGSRQRQLSMLLRRGPTSPSSPSQTQGWTHKDN